MQIQNANIFSKVTKDEKPFKHRDHIYMHIPLLMHIRLTVNYIRYLHKDNWNGQELISQLHFPRHHYQNLFSFISA